MIAKLSPVEDTEPFIQFLMEQTKGTPLLFAPQLHSSSEVYVFVVTTEDGDAILHECTASSRGRFHVMWKSIETTIALVNQALHFSFIYKLSSVGWKRPGQGICRQTACSC